MAIVGFVCFFRPSLYTQVKRNKTLTFVQNVLTTLLQFWAKTVRNMSFLLDEIRNYPLFIYSHSTHDSNYKVTHGLKPLPLIVNSYYSKPQKLCWSIFVFYFWFKYFESWMALSKTWLVVVCFQLLFTL